MKYVMILCGELHVSTAVA